jgi:Prophage minor tail protein Z (GPZ)
MRLTVSIDISGALKKCDRVAEEYPQAVARAINKTAVSARAQAAREIRNVGYRIKIAQIKKQLIIRRATRAELQAVIRASGRPIPLINYNARQNKQGVSVAVLRGGTTIKHAFIATMPSGHRGVFLRKDYARTMSRHEKHGITHGAGQRGKHGLPIFELFGPSIPAAFANETVQTALKQVIRQRFEVVLAQEIRFVRLNR